MKKVHVFYIFAILLGWIRIVVDASHFLGGTITWRTVNQSINESPINIVITQTYLWTWSLAQCTNSDIANNNVIPILSNFNGVSDKLNCIGNCSSAIGYSPPSILPYCTDVSSFQGATVGQRSDIVRLIRGSDFMVAFANNAWRPLATASAAAWSIAMRINLAPRSDNGLYNTAPVTTMMSPINIPVGIRQMIRVPVGDADGDTLRCRWSNGSNECGDVCPPGSLPNNTIIYPNCTIFITGTTTNQWFAVTLMVEDFISQTSVIPLSAVPVQFLVQVIPRPTCSNQPSIVGLLAEQSCTSVKIGQTFSSRLIVINNCGPDVNISDIATLSFSGMMKSSIIKVDSTTYYKNLTWTPTIAQLGYQIMCAMAVDSQSSQSSQYCFKFYVSKTDICACPGEICPTTTTTTTTSTSQSASLSTSTALPSSRITTTTAPLSSPLTTITSLPSVTTTLATTRLPDTTSNPSTTTSVILSTTSNMIISSIVTYTLPTVTTTMTMTTTMCIFTCDGVQAKISFNLLILCCMIIVIRIVRPIAIRQF